MVQPVLDRAFAGQAFARQLGGADPGDVLKVAAALLAEAPMTRAELRAALAGQWPGGEPEALAYVVTYLLPVVQVPPRGIWGARAPARWTPAEAWTGRGLDRPDPEQLFLRYLRAFGPATVEDAQTWSGLTRLQEIADRLRPARAHQLFRAVLGHAKEGAPTCHSVDRSHLLSPQQHTAELKVSQGLQGGATASQAGRSGGLGA